MSHRFTYVTHAELALPLVRRPAGRVHARPRGSTHATEVGDVVERASHKVVANLACRSRRLLVAQQVTAAAGAGRDKAIKDLIALWIGSLRLPDAALRPLVARHP